MKNIFVGMEGALRQLFAAFGPVDRVKIMMDSYTGKSRGVRLCEDSGCQRCPQQSDYL